MAIVRRDFAGHDFSRRLFMVKSFRRGDRSLEARVEADKAIYLSEKKKTIASAVETFKTRERFERTMSPLNEYKDDPTAWDFIQGVIARFNEIEREKADGFDWVYRELQATA